MIFRTAVHARNHSDPQPAWTPWECRGRRGKCFRAKTIPDHVDFVPWQPLLNKSLGSRIRITNHGIAPAKYHALGARLPRREQVTELALAADHYRNTRQARRR